MENGVVSMFSLVKKRVIFLTMCLVFINSNRRRYTVFYYLYSKCYQVTHQYQQFHQLRRHRHLKRIGFLAVALLTWYSSVIWQPLHPATRNPVFPPHLHLHHHDLAAQLTPRLSSANDPIHVGLEICRDFSFLFFFFVLIKYKFKLKEKVKIF